MEMAYNKYNKNGIREEQIYTTLQLKLELITMEVVPLLIKKTQKMIVKNGIIKHLYTCFDGYWGNLFKYAATDEEAKEKFKKEFDPSGQYEIEFIEPSFKQLADEDLFLLRIKN